MGFRLEKVAKEWRTFKEAKGWQPGSKGGPLHWWVNLRVESFRHMPYTVGHLQAFADIAFVVLVLLGVIQLHRWAS